MYIFGERPEVYMPGLIFTATLQLPFLPVSGCLLSEFVTCRLDSVPDAFDEKKFSAEAEN